jgi:hypothetical protein
LAGQRSGQKAAAVFQETDMFYVVDAVWLLISETCFTSQIMAAIREIKALVAQREIGYFLVSQSQGQPKPVMKRRINDLVIIYCPLGVSSNT